MSSVLDCPACRKPVSFKQELIGRVVACPHCGGHFSMAGPDVGPVSVAAPQDPGRAYRPPIRFTFSCQRCASVLEARDGLCGRQGSCPTCGAIFIVPPVDPDTGMAVGPATVADDGQFPTPMHAYATAGGKAPRIRRLPDGTQVVVCPRCDAKLPVDSDACSTCGIPFTVEGAASVVQAGPDGNNLATASLSVGVLSLLTSCMPILGPVAIGLGVAGLYRAPKTPGGNTGRNLAVAGIICGVASLVICGVMNL